MYRFNKIKAVLLFFILGIVVFGCQNAPNSSAQEEVSATSVEKVYLTLEVEGMTCGGCERTVQGALTAIEGIDSAFASHVDKQVKIFVDTAKVNIIEMQKAIDAKGYTTGNIVE